LLGRNPAAVAEGGVAVEAKIAAAVEVRPLTGVVAAEARVVVPEAVAAADEVGAAAAAVSCVHHHELFFCEQLAARHHVSHWHQQHSSHYSFAGVS
jgi:hypothetical protein